LQVFVVFLWRERERDNLSIVSDAYFIACIVGFMIVYWKKGEGEGFAFLVVSCLLLRLVVNRQSSIVMVGWTPTSGTPFCISKMK
jgi:hypothetical protein